MTRTNYENEEMDYVEELRHRLKGEMNVEMYEDTSLFVRFLRARNHDLRATENMLRNHINWRKVNRVDTVLSWYKPHEVSDKYIPLSPMGFDKEGAPIVYSHFGNLDTRGCLKSIKMTEITNFCIHRLEHDTRTLGEQTIKLKTKTDKWVYIFNFENFSLATATHKPSVETVGKMVSLYEANYPERLKLAVLINASWYFQIAYALIKPLLTGPTLDKIKIYGKEGWQEELLKHIDADVLPKFLGGNCTDPDGDPMCKTIVNHGGKVPEKYFAINVKNNFITQPGVKKLSINRMSKVSVELEVLYPGSDIEWEFQTKGKDIAFTLLYNESKYSDSEAKALIPKQRVDTTISSEIGVFKCDKSGIYYLEFDNSYSWIHQKEVYYKAQVICPHTQNDDA